MTPTLDCPLTYTVFSIFADLNGLFFGILTPNRLVFLTKKGVTTSLCSFATIYSASDRVLSVTCSILKTFSRVFYLSVLVVCCRFMFLVKICSLTKRIKSSSPVAFLKPNLVISSLLHIFFGFSGIRLKILVVTNN